MNIDWLEISGASASVTTMTMKNSAKRAFEANHFLPLITHSSPSRTAVVVKTCGSAPPCGSVIAKQETISPASKGSSQRFFCSAVPK
ncbi:hypothetical protein D9M71_226670 [compost metagenome]